MRSTGQRQDVAFLALGVSTLAVAVAIMIGVRALSRRPKEQPKPTVGAEAPAPKPPPVPPPATTKRDPFLDQSKTPQPGGKAAKEQPEFKLVGIVSGREPMAVVRRGGRHYYLRVGQTVVGYTLAVIGRDRVTLVKGEERITLELRPPGSEEGE